MTRAAIIAAVLAMGLVMLLMRDQVGRASLDRELQAAEQMRMRAEQRIDSLRSVANQHALGARMARRRANIAVRERDSLLAKLARADSIIQNAAVYSYEDVTDSSLAIILSRTLYGPGGRLR